MKLTKWLVTHVCPHLDEIFAILLLRIYGKEKYPGVDTAEIVFVDASNGLIKHKEGSLYIGVSSDASDGDKLDEHPVAGRSRKKGQSAASLAAIDLGIQDRPEIKELLKHVTNEDLRGGAGFMHLSRQAKLLYGELEPMEVIDWATVALKATLNEQTNLLNEEGLREFRLLVKTMEIKHSGKSMKIGFIKTDNPLAGKCSRLEGYKILIQMNTDGHVQIFSRKRDKLDMRDIVRLLRIEELTIARKSIPRDWKLLEGENCEVCPLWYRHPEAGFVMNGSETHRNVPVTAIPVDRIMHLVALALDDMAEQNECKVCTHAPKASGMLVFNCPFYEAGLLHCRAVRFQEHKERSVPELSQNQ
ncbi:MAG: hypothetical protein WC229_01865 [Candidatus Paceibacterota bacterium]|jgi:hypothetical protein